MWLGSKNIGRAWLLRFASLLFCASVSAWSQDGRLQESSPEAASLVSSAKLQLLDEIQAYKLAHPEARQLLNKIADVWEADSIAYEQQLDKARKSSESSVNQFDKLLPTFNLIPERIDKLEASVTRYDQTLVTQLLQAESEASQAREQWIWYGLAGLVVGILADEGVRFLRDKFTGPNR
jgi:hypothetical protein